MLALRTRIITVVSGRTRRTAPLTLHNEGYAAFRVWSAQRPESVVLNSHLSNSLTEFYHNTGKYSSSDRIRATYTALHIFFISPAFRLGSSLASRVTVYLIQQVNVLKDAVRFRLYSHTVAQSHSRSEAILQDDFQALSCQRQVFPAKQVRIRHRVGPDHALPSFRSQCLFHQFRRVPLDLFIPSLHTFSELRRSRRLRYYATLRIPRRAQSP